MPDPGEPHRPEREHFASEADYREALETYAKMMYPPQEIKVIWESRMGVHEIERFLEDPSER